MAKWRTTLTYLAMGLTLAACNAGGGDEDGDRDAGSGSGSVEGRAQKGPFQAGETVTAVALESDGSLSDQRATGKTEGRGAYSLRALDWAGATQISIEGDFFDEIKANYIGASRTLNAVANLADGEILSANVNLYTHFVAARTRALMGVDESFETALNQARGELQRIFDLNSVPADLNLLQVVDESGENDSANLLMFSAALLQAGIDQIGLDAMADDFAVDGQINGAGLDEWAAIEAEQSDTLLADARLALKNQFSTEPPAGDGSGFAWLLNECALKKLNVTNWPVVCSEHDDDGTISRVNDPAEKELTAVFVAETPGSFWLTIDTAAQDNPATNTSWRLGGFSDTDSSYACSSYAPSDASGNAYAEGTTHRLSANRSYCLRASASPDHGSGGPRDIRVYWNKVSEGRKSINSTVKVPVGKTYRATVGNDINNKTIYSYYRVEVSSRGNHVVTVDDFNNGGGGTLIVSLFGDVDDNGNTTFNSGDQIVKEWGEESGTTITQFLEPGVYGIRVQNNTDRRGSSLDPRIDARPVGFNLLIEEASAS